MADASGHIPAKKARPSSRKLANRLPGRPEPTRLFTHDKCHSACSTKSLPPRFEFDGSQGGSAEVPRSRDRYDRDCYRVTSLTSAVRN
jgi:hypothetical protein